MSNRDGEREITNNRNMFISFFVNIFAYIDEKLYVRAEMNRLKSFSIDRILLVPTAKKLLRAYLQADSFFVSEALILFECYNICNKMLTNTALLNDGELESELYGFCPESWRQRLQDEFKFYHENGSLFKLQMALSYLRGQSLHNLEFSREFILFRRELKRGSGRIKLLLARIYKNNFHF